MQVSTLSSLSLAFRLRTGQPDVYVGLAGALIPPPAPLTQTTTTERVEMGFHPSPPSSSPSTRASTSFDPKDDHREGGDAISTLSFLSLAIHTQADQPNVDVGLVCVPQRAAASLDLLRSERPSPSPSPSTHAQTSPTFISGWLVPLDAASASFDPNDNDGKGGDGISSLSTLSSLSIAIHMRTDQPNVDVGPAGASHRASSSFGPNDDHREGGDAFSTLSSVSLPLHKGTDQPNHNVGLAVASETCRRCPRPERRSRGGGARVSTFSFLSLVMNKRTNQPNVGVGLVWCLRSCRQLL
jgi:hypothetical protein